jgi:hypothetical protein
LIIRRITASQKASIAAIVPNTHVSTRVLRPLGLSVILAPSIAVQVMLLPGGQSKFTGCCLLPAFETLFDKIPQLNRMMNCHDFQMHRINVITPIGYSATCAH